MKLNDAVWGALLLLLASAILVHVQSFGKIPGQQYGPAIFPGLVAAGLGICGVLLIFEGLAARRHGRDHANWIDFAPWVRSPHHLLAFAVTIAVNVFYIAFVEPLGFIVTGVLYLSALFAVFGVRARSILPLAVVLTLTIHTAFYKLLRVPLPWGVLKDFIW